jgi:hypothetical protein
MFWGNVEFGKWVDQNVLSMQESKKKSNQQKLLIRLQKE